MFTVCPKCALTLVVTAADLRVAQGYVRCGRCLNVFNALARLSEERPGTAAAAPPDTGASASPEPAEPPQPSASSATLEETGEIEIELDASVLAIPTEAAAGPEGTPEPDVEPHPPGSTAMAQEERPAPEEAAAEPAELQEQEPAVSPPPAPPEDAGAREGAAAGSGEEPPPTAPAVPASAPESAESSAASDASDGQNTNTPPQPPESAFELGTRRPRAALAWSLGAGALAIALALQIVNHYRDALAGDPSLRKPLTAVYSALGVKLAPRWDVRAYDVRQLGASVAGAAAGEIVVRASVKNAASRAQPLPLLRVTLQDRFGNRIAARDVPPSDYLPSPVAPGALLAAGSRVDASMVFVDPGPQAVGFEIDACLRQRGGQVACAHGP